MPTQPLGWFKKQVTSPDDLKGIKYRTVGLSADLFKEMGAAVTILPGGEIVPAMDRGLLDAAEFNNPSSDKLLGFADVSKDYMLQSYHQRLSASKSSSTRRYDALAPELQRSSSMRPNPPQRTQLKAMDRYASDPGPESRRGTRHLM